jgi:foldase protein PrsA
MSKAFRVTAGSVTLLLAVLLASCSGGGAVMTVNGQQISRAQLDDKLESSPYAMQVLRQLVQEDLIRQYADKNHITVSDSEVNQREQQLKQNYPGSEWSQLLAARGLTEKDVHDALQLNLILQDALGSNVHVTDAQIRQYFNKNHAAFDTPEKICASHILVSDPATAQKVESQLKSNGSNFAQLAQKYSIDPGSKTKGGDLGCFPRGQMVAAFDQAAFALPVGKISPPVKSPFGYHIILVKSKQPAVKATLASAYDKIKTQLEQQQEQPLIEPFMANLQQQASIVANDSRFSALASTPAPGPAVTPSVAPATAAPAKPVPTPSNH